MRKHRYCVPHTLIGRYVLRGNMGTVETIGIGVFVGVLTALLLFVAKSFWVNTIVPFWQKVRYQGADISGSWRASSKSEEGTETDLSLNLSQSAHVISGSMNFTLVTNDSREQIDFNLNGSYWETYLCLNAQSKNKQAFSGGTMYLQSKSNGREFSGYFAFRDGISNCVTSVPIRFERT